MTNNDKIQLKVFGGAYTADHMGRLVVIEIDYDDGRTAEIEARIVGMQPDGSDLIVTLLPIPKISA